MRLDSTVAARKHYEQLLHEDDQNAVAHYWIGRARLASGDERGLESLARAVELDVHGTPESAVAAIDFLIDRHRLDEVDTWRVRAPGIRGASGDRGRRALAAAPDDRRPHGLPAEAVDQIREELVGLRKIRRAYIVRKRCSSSPRKSQLWVLGIAFRPRRFRPRRQRHVDELIQTVAGRVEVLLGDRFWVVIVEGVYAPLAPAMAAIPGAQIVGRRYRTARLRRRVQDCAATR